MNLALQLKPQRANSIKVYALVTIKRKKCLRINTTKIYFKISKAYGQALYSGTIQFLRDSSKLFSEIFLEIIAGNRQGLKPPPGSKGQHEHSTVTHPNHKCSTLGQSVPIAGLWLPHKKFVTTALQPTRYCSHNL